jgi:hypothetical protein
MADDSGSGGILAGNNIYWLAGGAAVIVMASVIYAVYGTVDVKKPVPSVGDDKSTKPAGTTGGDSGNTATKSVPTKSASGTTDYTNLSNAKQLFPNMPDNAHGLNLGDDVIIKGGATIVRLDEGLNEKGTTKLEHDTSLGKVWKHDVSATIRAKNTYDYPFYRVRYEDINQKGSVLGKVEAGISNLFGFSDVGYIGADGFGQL